MGNSCMTGADCGATGSETRIYSYCLYWLFGTHSLWRDTLLSLDIVGRALVLTQSNVLHFVDSFLRSGCGEVEGKGGGERVRTGIVM